MSKLFTPGQVRPYVLSHCVVFAPITRLRSDGNDTPLPDGRVQAAETRDRPIDQSPDIISARAVGPELSADFRLQVGGIILDKGNADFVALGRHFVANPDLPETEGGSCDATDKQAANSL